MVGHARPCPGPHCGAVSCFGYCAHLFTLCFGFPSSQEPVIVPPLNLKRLTAAVLKTAIDSWIPASATKTEPDSQKPPGDQVLLVWSLDCENTL